MYYITGHFRISRQGNINNNGHYHHELPRQLLNMSQYITHLAVSLDQAEEQLLEDQGFEKVHVDLNTGAGGNHIYLWFKKESGAAPVTRAQVTFNEEMEVGLTKAGYIKLPQNLNSGTSGSPLYMWYSRATTAEYDTPILELDVTLEVKDEAEKFRVGGHWEKVSCDLNLGTEGKRVYAFVKRTAMTFICDVTATDSYDLDAQLFSEGYTRLDENTNQGAGGADVFIWYRKTTNTNRALTGLQISTTPIEAMLLSRESYKPVNVNLNQGTGGNEVKLWYKKDDREPLRIMTLLPSAAVDAYEKAGFLVIKRNLNAGNSGQPLFLGLLWFWYE